MDIRIVGIATAAAAVLVAGCGGNNGSAATPTSSVAKASSSAAPTPVASNEDQIRDVLNKEGAALSAWDFDTVAELTCAKFRDQARSADNAVPPMTMFSADRAASMGAQSFASLLGEQFGGASDQSLQAVADAVIRRDEPGYKAAMLDVVKQSMNIQLVLVDNIVVRGDTATADTTVTQRTGNHPPDTRTSPANLVREDGKWLDCTPPAQP